MCYVCSIRCEMSFFGIKILFLYYKMLFDILTRTINIKSMWHINCKLRKLCFVYNNWCADDVIYGVSGVWMVR